MTIHDALPATLSFSPAVPAPANSPSPQRSGISRLLRDTLYNDDQLFRMQISPLGPVRQSAARVQAKVPLPSVDDEQLVEVMTSSGDGMTRFEIDSEFPGHLDGPDAVDWYFRARASRKLLPFTPEPEQA